jgi:hypothetical protein
VRLARRYQRPVPRDFGSGVDLREAAAEGPEVAQNAPYTTPVRRLDEVAAVKRPIIRQALG